MDEQELQKRIDAANDEMLSGEVEPMAPAAQPVDYYQKARNERINEFKVKYVKGSSRKVTDDLECILEPLACKYRKAMDDKDMLLANGDRNRAEMIQQQYMEDEFLPAVETLIAFNSVDEVLNSRKALEMLDDYVILTGAGSGYTASYIKQAHAGERGLFSGTSDSEILDGVRQLKSLAANDQIRLAVALAKRLKGKIDNGNNIASEDDYELIQKVALR